MTGSGSASMRTYGRPLGWKDRKERSRPAPLLIVLLNPRAIKVFALNSLIGIAIMVWEGLATQIWAVQVIRSQVKSFSSAGSRRHRERIGWLCPHFYRTDKESKGKNSFSAIPEEEKCPLQARRAWYHLCLPPLVSRILCALMSLSLRTTPPARH